MIAESERGFAWTKALLGNTFMTFIQESTERLVFR